MNYSFTHYYKDKKTSVGLKIKGKEYIGKSCCCDEDTPSELKGGIIAEMKAWMEYYKDKRREYYKKEQIIKETYGRMFDILKEHPDALTEEFISKAYDSAIKENYNHILIYTHKIEFLKKKIALF